MPFIWKKLLRLVLVVLAVAALTFLMVNILPGDVADMIGGQGASPEDIEAIRKDLGLDRNILVRFVSWLGDLIQGDLGQSYLTGEPVLHIILSRLPVTVELLVISQLFTLLL
ncbi:MAG: ABC transporter permease, partial [Desulfobacterales bacterium]